MKTVTTTSHVWRFGYGSNIGLTTLKQKKNLHPSKYLAGTIQGWDLCFTKAMAYVEPGFAGVREDKDTVLHGAAFRIPQEEAEGLDRQEGGYNVLACEFISYDGEKVPDVGLYVPKKSVPAVQDPTALPSLRYLRLIQNGAREAGLAQEWIDRLDCCKYYITPPEVRAQTKEWIAEFLADPERKDVFWTSEQLSNYNGSSTTVVFPAHVAVMEYIVTIPPGVWVFGSWKGHNITRRNLLQFNGKSLDTNDKRFGQEGYRPFPKISECSEEEKEFVLQNLESVLHQGGKIVARLEDFMDDQNL